MKRKRLTSIMGMVIAVMMCISLLPTTALAADSDFVIENGVLVKYNGKGGDIVIPDGVTSIGYNAFYDCTDITSVVIPKGVTSIADSAFAYSEKLTSITILDPESLVSTGSWCFGLSGDTISNEHVTFYSLPGYWVENYAANYKAKFAPLEGTTPTTPTTPPTTDKPSAWAETQVNTAIAANIVPTALQGQYTQATTRAEFCALAVALYENVKGTEITERVTFNDTTDINVQKAAAIGVVSGVGNNNFAPNDTLTREQAATMLSRLAAAIGKPLTEQAATFADNNSISQWAFSAVGQVQANGVMGGVGNNTFAPQEQYTREQSIVTITRLYDIVK